MNDINEEQQKAQTSKEGGAILVLHSDMGEKYFLILHTLDDRWELPKTLLTDEYSGDQAVMYGVNKMTGLKAMQIMSKNENTAKVDVEGNTVEFGIYYIEANMNSPIVIDKNSYRNYLWATGSRVIEKLTSPEEKEVVKQCP